jgi:hypothetical protein
MSSCLLDSLTFHSIHWLREAKKRIGKLRFLLKLPVRWSESVVPVFEQIAFHFPCVLGCNIKKIRPSNAIFTNTNIDWLRIGFLWPVISATSTLKLKFTAKYTKTYSSRHRLTSAPRHVRLPSVTWINTQFRIFSKSHCARIRWMHKWKCFVGIAIHTRISMTCNYMTRLRGCYWVTTERRG